MGKCIRACISICDLMRDGEVEEREGGRGVRLVNVAVGGCVELEVDSLSACALPTAACCCSPAPMYKAVRPTTF